MPLDLYLDLLINTDLQFRLFEPKLKILDLLSSANPNKDVSIDFKCAWHALWGCDTGLQFRSTYMKTRFLIRKCFFLNLNVLNPESENKASTNIS